jgi:hypothetical protein
MKTLRKVPSARITRDLYRHVQELAATTEKVMRLIANLESLADRRNGAESHLPRRSSGKQGIRSSRRAGVQ